VLSAGRQAACSNGSETRHLEELPQFGAKGLRLFADAGASIKLGHQRGLLLDPDSRQGEAGGSQETALGHFLPQTKVTCFQGPHDTMGELLTNLRTSPLRALYNESVLAEGSCDESGYELGPIDTCFGKTFMNGADPERQTQAEHRSVATWATQYHSTEQEAWSQLRKLCVLKAPVEAAETGVAEEADEHFVDSADDSTPSVSGSTVGPIPSIASVTAPPAASNGDLLPLPLAAYKPLAKRWGAASSPA